MPLHNHEHAPVKVEWDRVRANFGREYVFEFIKGDSTGAISVFYAIRNPDVSCAGHMQKGRVHTRQSTGTRCSILRLAA
jgi:hypothetical protein